MADVAGEVKKIIMDKLGVEESQITPEASDRMKLPRPVDSAGERPV